MHLDADEIAGLRARFQARRQNLMRRTFAARDTDRRQREAYFDAWYALAKEIAGMSDPDILCLLEMGFQAGVPLSKSDDYRYVHARGRWYGRRLWIWDQMERRDLARFEPADLERMRMGRMADAS